MRFLYNGLGGAKILFSCYFRPKFSCPHRGVLSSFDVSHPHVILLELQCRQELKAKSTKLANLLNVTTNNCRFENTELQAALHFVAIHKLLRFPSELNYAKDI